MRSFTAVSSLLLTVALLAGCGDDDPGTDAGSAPTTSGSPTSETTSPSPSGQATERGTVTESAAPGSRITVEESDFGPMLFDEDGRAIYMWEVEESSKAECYGDCAEAWPPVLTEGKPVAGDGVRPGLLGTTKRTDGSTQVTYGGHPLYLYAHEGPGEVKCHNVATHGGLWWVLMPDGEPAPA